MVLGAAMAARGVDDLPERSAVTRALSPPREVLRLTAKPTSAVPIAPIAPTVDARRSVGFRSVGSAALEPRTPPDELSEQRAHDARRNMANGRLGSAGAAARTLPALSAHAMQRATATAELQEEPLGHWMGLGECGEVQPPTTRWAKHETQPIVPKPHVDHPLVEQRSPLAAACAFPVETETVRDRKGGSPTGRANRAISADDASVNAALALLLAADADDLQPEPKPMCERSPISSMALPLPPAGPGSTTPHWRAHAPPPLAPHRSATSPGVSALASPAMAERDQHSAGMHTVASLPTPVTPVAKVEAAGLAASAQYSQLTDHQKLMMIQRIEESFSSLSEEQVQSTAEYRRVPQSILRLSRKRASTALSLSWSRT